MIRQFYLQNENNQIFGLNSIKKGLLIDPAGLGYDMEYSYARIGNKWKANYLRDQQPMLTGTIVIGTQDPYQAEQDLLLFIRNSKSIVFVKETSVGRFCKDVDIVSYGKTEITEGYTLQCPISFMAKSLWYQPATIKVVLDASSEDEKRYPYDYPYKYNDYSNGEVNIMNDGSVEAAFTLDIYGPIVNPRITVSADGMEDRKVEIIGEADAGEHILYSSIDGELRLDLKNGNSYTNLANALDISNMNFFKLPIGSSIITVKADSAITEPIIITMYKYYRTI